jgi:CheY-like chemotaxis protein
MIAAIAPTVLLADDDDDNRAAERLVLEEAGYFVAQARTGFDALALTLATHPRVVLLDIVLPGIDGQQLARMLRANPATHQIALVALSASCAAEDRRDALEAGFNEFLPKPVSPLRLMETVAKLTIANVGL